MRRLNKDWNAKKAYEERTKKSAASDEYIHNFRQERKRTAEYDTEQGADLPNSLIKQARKNQEVNEAASRGEYTTKHRSGQVRTHKLPQEQAIDWFNTVIEDPSLSDQVRKSLVQANFGMQNAFELTDSDTMTWVQAMKMQDGNQDLIESSTELNDKVENENEEVEPELQPDQYRESTFEKGKETTSKIGKIGDENWETDEKQNFLDRTADSPAAKAGLDDDLRWQARKRYEDFLKKRKVESSLGKAKK